MVANLKILIEIDTERVRSLLVPALIRLMDAVERSRLCRNIRSIRGLRLFLKQTGGRPEKVRAALAAWDRAYKRFESDPKAIRVT